MEIISKNYLSLFGKLLDFKKTISVVRGYGINCQIIVQSIAQLSDRYPIKEWEEIVGNCDTQLVLGCNDMMTSEYISKRCGAVTIQLTNSMSPQTPLFSPITREVTGYRQTKANNTRPLMYPEEILQMDNRECLILIRGQKPLKGLKIIPDELSDHRRLKYSRVADYIPKWRKHEEETEIHKEEYIPTDSTEEPVTPPNCENNKGAEQLSFIDNEPRVEFEPDDSDDMPETTSASSSEKFTQTTSNEILNN